MPGGGFVVAGHSWAVATNANGEVHLNGMIDAVKEVIAQVRPDVKVIPGHGHVSSLTDLQAYLTMLKATRDAVAHELKGGKTLDQMQQAKVLDRWKSYSGEFVSEDAFLETLYISLTARKIGEPIRHN
jgi:cyclase